MNSRGRMKEFHLYGPVTENKYMTVNTTAGNNNNKYKIAETSRVSELTMNNTCRNV